MEGTAPSVPLRPPENRFVTIYPLRGHDYCAYMLVRLTFVGVANRSEVLVRSGAGRL